MSLNSQPPLNSLVNLASRSTLVVAGEVALAADEADMLLGAVPVLRGARLGCNVEALVFFSQDDVDDARDGIRAVQSGGAILQNLDLLDGGEGNGASEMSV